MQHSLCEYVNSRGVQVQADQHLGILRGVKLLGLESRNGNRYLPTALRNAAARYEGIKVHVNHAPPGREQQPRDYQDRLGVLRGITLREDGLYADLHFNLQHAVAPQLLWDAQHAPENVGFSHQAVGRGRRAQGQFLVEEIVSVQCVDLVTEPATTRGLFEAAEPRSESLAEPPANLPAPASSFPTTSATASSAALPVRTSALSFQERKDALRTRCRAAQLPEESISEVFLHSLLLAPDDATVAALLEDRRECLGARVRPRAGTLEPRESEVPPRNGRELANLLLL